MLRRAPLLDRHIMANMFVLHLVLPTKHGIAQFSAPKADLHISLLLRQQAPQLHLHLTPVLHIIENRLFPS